MKSGKLAPHTGQELALMLAKKKNVALFHQEDFPAELHHYIAQGQFRLKTIHFPPQPYPGFIVYRPGFEEQANRLADLLISRIGKGFDLTVEREIGQILGYDEIDIAFYLAHIQRKK